MNWLAFIAVILTLLVSPVKGAQANNDVMIVNIAVPASLTPTATSGIIYFDIMNHGAEGDELLSISTKAAKTAMLHESYKEGDLAKMRMLESLDVPPGGSVKLQQGGKHVMLTGLKIPLTKGDKITITLNFRKAGEINVDATVGDPVTGHIHSD